MSFIWPAMLVAVLLVPVGAALYTLIGRRRLRLAGAYGLLGPPGVAPPRRGVRQRLPGVLLVLGFGILAFAMARPQSVVSLPRLEGTIILAFDVSGSMAATDFEPTRMEAAKAAARTFVERQPSGVVIGVVSFSDSGFAVQVPTSEHQTVVAAINRLSPERGTSLGRGILKSLDSIAAVESGEATNFYSNRDPGAMPEPTPVPAGTYAAAAVVLLTDGENNEEPDPLEAAQVAADRGIRVHTVGIGNAAGVTLETEGFRVHTRLDEAMLQAIAERTDGTYYGGAETHAELAAVYESLDTRLVVRPESIEITAIFIGAGIIILLLGTVSSLLWLGRLS